jgi:hypothetical protein
MGSVNQEPSITQFATLYLFRESSRFVKITNSFEYDEAVSGYCVASLDMWAVCAGVGVAGTLRGTGDS